MMTKANDPETNENQVEAGASLLVRNLSVKNDGWVPTRLSEEENRGEEEGGLPEAICVRGFRFEKKACYRVRVTGGGRWVIVVSAPCPPEGRFGVLLFVEMIRDIKYLYLLV